MALQFLLNLFIAFLWMLFNDVGFHLTTFVKGFVVGTAIVFLMRHFFGGKFYLYRMYAVIKLVLIFISETIQSAIMVIKHILSPEIIIEPGIFNYETILEGEWVFSTLALFLTLTPVSVVMYVVPDGNLYYILMMYISI